MYNKRKIARSFVRSELKNEKVYEGERIEEKVFRILNNGEAITDGAPQIYTERSEGVLPAYNIRTDRMEVAQDAMDKVSKDRIAKREAKVLKMDANEGAKGSEGGDSGKGTGSDAGGESTKGTK